MIRIFSLSVFLCLLLSIKILTVAEFINERSTLAEKYDSDVLGPLPNAATAAASSNPTQSPITHSSIRRFPIAEFDFHHIYFPFVITAWLLMANLAKILYQMTPKVPKFLPESCLLILLGLFIGIVLRFGFNMPTSPFTEEIFFLFILPPIIFDAGYFMPKRMFFNNLGTILLMAFVGTIFNIFAIGFSLWGCGLTGIYGSPIETPSLTSTLLFTSVIAATDPVAVIAVFEELHVNELLYIIVFGESLLNDAVTVVIYHVIEVFSSIGFENVNPQDIMTGLMSFFVVSLGGVLIGVIWGLLTGFLTRFTHRVLIVETSFIFLMSYLAYLNAEMFHMSAILASTFCGITIKGYVEANVSKTSKVSIRNGVKMVANTAETVVFILLGIATIQSRHVWNTPFVILSVLFCSIFRIIGVILLVFISNHFRLYKLTVNDQIIMSLAGLRGAVAFGLVLLMDERLVPQQPMFLTTTLVIIFFTVFIQGIAVKPILKWLNIKLQQKNELSLCQIINERFTDHVMTGIENIVGINGNYNIRVKFKCFSKRFIEPWILKDTKQPDVLTNILQGTELEAVRMAGSNIKNENLVHYEVFGKNCEGIQHGISLQKMHIQSKIDFNQGESPKENSKSKGLEEKHQHYLDLGMQHKPQFSCKRPKSI